MEIGQVPAQPPVATGVSSVPSSAGARTEADGGSARGAGRGPSGALEHAAALLGLSAPQLLGVLTPDDRAVLAAARADVEEVQAAVATERYLGRLWADLTATDAAGLRDRYLRGPHPVEPAHLAGIVMYLEQRVSARRDAGRQPAVPRVDRVV